MKNLSPLAQLEFDVAGCQLCPLYQKMPEGCFPVSGVGKDISEIMLVGEALGKDEVNLQQPFVGLAGQMLNKLLADAGIKREDCYITNVVKCRPYEGKKNRKPSKEEIAACKEWVFKEIDLVQPKLIFSLGRIPSFLLLKEFVHRTTILRDILGQSFTVDYTKAKIIPNYHPSHLLQYGYEFYNQTVQIFKDGINEL